MIKVREIRTKLAHLIKHMKRVDKSDAYQKLKVYMKRNFGQ